MIRCLKCFQIFDEAYDVCPHCGYLAGSPPEIAFHIYPGTILNDRYVVGTTLGHGGFGITYNAWDQQLNTHVAIKEYFPNGLVNRIPGTADVLLLSGEKENQYYAGLQQFMNEAKQTVQFANHPNIVHVFDFFEANHTAYIVMEFLDGISLKGLLKQWDGKLSIEQALDVGISVCDALTEIHSKGVLHRDVNPANIFICLNDTIKLIDFGSARISDSEEEKTRSVIITPGYAPPEQYRAKSKQDGRTDIYALCAVLYRCVTGVKPMESLDRTVEDHLENPMKLNDEIEEWLDKIIMRGMALDQELRFKNAQELKEALQTHRKVEYPEEQIKKRRKRRIIQFAGALAVLLAAGGGVFAYYMTHRAPKLEGVDILIWARDDEDSRAAFDEIKANYEEDFSDQDLTVDVEYIAADEYADKLAEVIGTEDCPDIFYTEYLSEDKYDSLASVKNVYDYIRDDDTGKLSNHLYLDEYKDTDDGKIMVPLGFDQVSLFINKSATGLVDDKALSEFEISEDIFSGDTAESIDFLEDYADENDKISVSDEAVEHFAAKDIEFLLAGAADYKDIQAICSQSTGADITKTVAGNYYAVPVTKDDKMLGYYTDYLGISADTVSKRKEAAQMFIGYLLQDQSQRLLHLQNSDSIPLNKASLEQFINYNSTIGFISDSEGQLEMK